MSYIKVTFPNSTEEQNELIAAVLGTCSFDFFDETEEGFNAYTEKDLFQEKQMVEILDSIDLLHSLPYQKEEIEKVNWNEEWEKNFPPLMINKNWSVRADFHQPMSTLHEIIITPKMSFGTGHHATTSMMMQLLDEEGFNSKSVFDFGSGTGILAIMAEMKGSKNIYANDIEDWAYENAIENAEKNNCSHIQFFHGGIEKIPVQPFDIIIANINKNVITASIDSMMALTHHKTIFFISGILCEDETDITNLFKNHHYTVHQKLSKDNWMAIKFIKS
ncbi:MAG: 50S ribosomal protein L11 methyltransferase [Chitinophagales bacterium]|nr:50S ribosomal protein L11 methyltransferase [Chitinophagales bacterium]